MHLKICVDNQNDIVYSGYKRRLHRSHLWGQRDGSAVMRMD